MQQRQDVRDLLPATLGKPCGQLACHLEQWPASRDTAVAQAPDRSLRLKVTGAERVELPKDAGRRVPQLISSTRNLLCYYTYVSIDIVRSSVRLLMRPETGKLGGGSKLCPSISDFG
jgi:hypothetical protein